MKCKACGEELGPGNTCSRCSSDAGAKIEVKYKDFKVSECLEIRKKGPGPGEGDRVPEKTDSLQQAMDRDSTKREGCSRGKSVRIALVLIFSLAAAAGIIYLLRLLRIF